MSEMKVQKNDIPVRILFIIRDFEHGGIGRVLLNLLNRLEPSKICADVMVCNPSGIFADDMAKFHVLPCNKLMRLLSCNYRKEHGFVKYSGMFLKLIRHTIIRLLGKDLVLQAVEKYIAKKNSGKYDIVWACSEDTPAQIAQRIPGCAKVLWIHNHYANAYPQIKATGLPDYKKFNNIVCVSHDAAEVLGQILLEKDGIDIRDKVMTLYNIVNEQEINLLAEQKIEDPRFKKDSFVIVSVGRLAFPKRFEIVPAIAKQLEKCGKKFYWYIIGGGAPVMQHAIESEISKNGVENEVILLGVKSNPYPYIAQADLLVLTSLYETYPTVVNEAKVLGVPVVSSDFDGVSEIVSPEDGLFCPVEQMGKVIDEIMSGQKGDIFQTGRKKSFSSHNQKVIDDFMDLVCSLSLSSRKKDSSAVCENAEEK